MDAHKPPPRLWRNEKWQQCYTHFIANIASSKTRYQYDKTLRRFFLFVAEKHGKQRTPDQISSTDIEEFLQQGCRTPGARYGKPLSPYTRNVYIMTFRAFYAYCGRAETEFRGKMVPLYRKSPPTEHIKQAKGGEVDRDMTSEEVKNFFAAIPRDTIIGKRDFCLFFTALCTGRRRFEITHLLRGDLEKTHYMDADGQEREGWRYWFRAKKRTNRESAEMPAAVIEAIRRYHTAYGLDFDTLPKEHPIFFSIPRRTRTTPLELNTADRRFRIYANAAGIAKNVVLHSLRWENAYQRSLANNNNLVEVMEELGWRNIAQVVHYVRRRRRKMAGDPTAAKVAAKFAEL